MKLADTELAENPDTDPKAIITYACWKFFTPDRFSTGRGRTSICSSALDVMLRG